MIPSRSHGRCARWGGCRAGASPSIERTLGSSRWRKQPSRSCRPTKSCGGCGCARSLRSTSSNRATSIRRRSSSKTACARARQLDDAVALGRTLLTARFFGRSADTEQRLACGHELIELGERTGMEVFGLVGCQQLWWCHRELGDRDESERWFVEAELRAPRPRPGAALAAGSARADGRRPGGDHPCGGTDVRARGPRTACPARGAADRREPAGSRDAREGGREVGGRWTQRRS